MQLWGRNAHFSTLISVGKVKRIYRKRWGKVDEFQNILRDKMQDKQDKNI